MKLNERDIEFFQALNQGSTGTWLLDYLDRAKLEMFNPETLTAENLTSKKEAWRFVEEHLINRIKLQNPEVENQTTFE